MDWKVPRLFFAVHVDSRPPGEAECDQGGVLDPQGIGKYHYQVLLSPLSS